MSTTGPVSPRYLLDNNQWYSRHIGMRYPSPFFDVGQLYMPGTTKELLQWCGFYAQTNPIIAAAVQKLAEYPVTDLIYEGVDPAVRRREERLARQLKLRAFQVEVGLDYFTYGNAFVSVYLPFARYLQCLNCRHEVQAAVHNRSKYRWRNHRFHLTCPRCGSTTPARVRDQYLRGTTHGVRLLRWNPENIEVKYVAESGSRRYYYNIPRSTLNDIALGDPDVLETVPLGFLDAARERKAVLFSQEGIYHLRRPTQAQKDMGWGQPLIFPVLKTAYYMQVLQKAQETIAQEYIVPFRVLFPGQSGGGADSPLSSYNLQNWAAVVRNEINNWKRDPNYIGVFPVNVAFQQWGGSGKALILHHELRFLAENMLAGMTVPVEFVYGGVQWQGTNTSVRALANMFESYNAQREELIVDFILGGIARHMGWESPKARFARFEMPDNLQRAMFAAQLAQGGKISNQRLLEEAGLDFDLEQERMRRELPSEQATQRRTQAVAASIQGESAVIQQRYQGRAQEMMAETQAAIQAKQLATQAQQQAMQMGQSPMPALPGPSLPAGPSSTPPGAATLGGGFNASGDGGMGGGDGGAGGAGGAAAQRLPLPLQRLGVRAEQGDRMAEQQLQRAKQAASQVRQLPENQQGAALQQLKATEPQVYQHVLALLEGRRGTQVNPLDGLRNPQPTGSGVGTDPARVIG